MEMKVKLSDVKSNQIVKILQKKDLISSIPETPTRSREIFKRYKELHPDSVSKSTLERYLIELHRCGRINVERGANAHLYWVTPNV